MNAEEHRVACPSCGSTAVIHYVYGMPTAEYMHEEEGEPDIVFMGCLIVPDAVATRCRQCGRTEPVVEDQEQSPAS